MATWMKTDPCCPQQETISGCFFSEHRLSLLFFSIFLLFNAYIMKPHTVWLTSVFHLLLCWGVYSYARWRLQLLLFLIPGLQSSNEASLSTEHEHGSTCLHHSVQEICHCTYLSNSYSPICFTSNSFLALWSSESTIKYNCPLSSLIYLHTNRVNMTSF